MHSVNTSNTYNKHQRDVAFRAAPVFKRYTHEVI